MAQHIHISLESVHTASIMFALPFIHRLVHHSNGCVYIQCNQQLNCPDHAGIGHIFEMQLLLSFPSITVGITSGDHAKERYDFGHQRNIHKSIRGRIHGHSTRHSAHRFGHRAKANCVYGEKSMIWIIWDFQEWMAWRDSTRSEEREVDLVVSWGIFVRSSRHSAIKRVDLKYHHSSPNEWDYNLETHPYRVSVDEEFNRTSCHHQRHGTDV